MRTMMTATVILAATFTTPAFSQAFVGEWVATAHVQDSEISERVSVAKSGDSYTITARLVSPQPEGAQSPEASPPANIKIEGNNFSYTRTLDFGGNKMEISYKGVVTGNTFTATAEVGGNAIPYTGVRAN